MIHTRQAGITLFLIGPIRLIGLIQFTVILFCRLLPADDPQTVSERRLFAGGHGEDGRKLLDKYGIQYNIVKTYSNGVRVGNVPNHPNGLKNKGTGQYWFPKEWNQKMIKKAGEYVANLKRNRNVADGIAVFGTYKGVRVGIKKTKGEIATVFPDSDQSKALKSNARKK